MALETVPLEHIPASHTIHISFFKDVQNAAFLHEQLLARNADFEYALIDASVVSLPSTDAPLSHMSLLVEGNMH